MKPIALLLLFCCFSITCLADTLTLPLSLQVIGEQAFYGDTSLDAVRVMENCTRIEKQAFANSSIKEIYIPDSVTFIASDAFNNDVIIYSSDKS